ncbi:MAG: transporter substrate-binding domain-containing protein [Pontiellaceae bacterium]|nr:transporter substrate-binding domain-containing protein [Pontiellaceae bacterium]MBN2784528.1 transporter substrate-binding domain-containing protein [Pontiellaceae bacterium]
MMRAVRHLPRWACIAGILLLDVLNVRATEPVRAGAEPDYPPFSFVSETGAPQGYSIDLLSKVLEVMGQRPEFQLAQWAEIKTALAEGKLDVLPIVAFSEDRAELFDFSTSYITLHGAVFVRDDETRITGIRDLKEYTVAVMRGDITEEYVRNTVLCRKMITTDTYPEAFRMLENGAVDAVLAQHLMGVTLLQQMGMDHIRTVGNPENDFHKRYCFAVQKGNTELLNLLNEGLAMVESQGILRGLEQKWMGRLRHDITKSRTIVYGGDLAFPPYEYLDKQGRPAGFNIELTRALARETGLNIVFQLDVWSSIRTRTTDGEIDMASMLYSPSREILLDYSQPHSVIYRAVFARKNSPPYHEFNDLKGHRVAVQKGDILEEFSIEQGLSEELISTPGFKEAIQLLHDGKVDYALSYYLPAVQCIQEEGWDNVVPVESRLLPAEYCYVVQKGDTDLLNLLNNGLAELKASGEYRRIYNEWLGPLDKNSGWQVFRKYLLWGIALILSLIAGGALIVASLRRQVKNRTVELHEANKILEESRKTALQMMEDAIRAKEQVELTQFAIDHAADAAYWIRPDSTFAYANITACHTLGYTKEELLALSIADIDPCFDMSNWKKNWNELRTRKTAAFESYHKTKDGRTFPVEVHITYLKYGDDEYHFSFVTDISKRREAEHAIRELNNLQSLILNNSSLGIALVRDRRFVWINPPACEMLGRPVEELNGASARLIYADDETFERIGREAYGCISNGERFTTEVQAMRKDGSLFWCRLFANAIDPKQPQAGSLWMMQDISDKIMSEQQLKLLSTVIEQSPQIVVITDIEGTIQYVNPAFERITGYSRQEVIGENPRILKSGHLTPAFYKDLWSTILSGKVWSGQLINCRKNGLLYTEEAVISPVMNQTGEITNFVGIKHDISDQIILEEELRQSQKMEAVGQLAGGIAHDFNNILQVVLGFSQLLEFNFDDGTEEMDSIQEIIKAANRASTLTNQLLTFSRRTASDRTNIILNDSIHEAKGLVRMLLGEQFELEISLEPDLHPVRAEQGQMTQVIMNLAVNARDAMGESGKLSITTENLNLTEENIVSMPSAKAGPCVCLSIRDTGCGIDAEVRERLFEPFFTTKEVGKGSGLGLAVVYGIIQQNDGWILVQSEVGEGSCFKIFFPAIDPKPQSGQDPYNETKPAGRILLVEPDAGAAKLFVDALNGASYAVELTDRPNHAMETLRQDPEEFDLIISDLNLSDMDGKEMYDQVREISARAPILFFGSYSDMKNRWPSIPDNKCFFTHKSFTGPSLIDTVNQIISSTL